MTTSTLGLSGTTQAAGSAVKFLDWRLAQDNITDSNMTKIDLFATNISASVVSLQGSTPFLTNATEAATNNYIATVSNFGAYTDGKIINLVLDVTSTGTTTLNINSLGIKSLYKIASNGIAGNLTSGDLVAGRPHFFMYNLVGGYWLWVDGTSADQVNVTTTVATEILLGSASGIVGSGISASSLSTNDGYFLVTQLSSNLRNETQIIAGSGIGLVGNTGASTIAVTANLIAGTNITLSANSSSSAVTINSETAASSIAPSTANYVVFGSLDSTLTNDKLITAGSGMAIENNIAASKIYLHTKLITGSGTTITTDTTASTLAVNVNASSPLSASGTYVTHNTSGVVAGTYTLSSTTIDATGHITSASSGLIASATQVSSGSSATALVSASGLSQSNYGVKTVCIPLVTGTTTLAGGEEQYVRIPKYMNGWKLADGAASCGASNGSGSSTSGSPSFNILRSSASSMTRVSMLTNLVTIDASEFDSSTSASPMTIAALNTVFTGDKVWAITSASGTGVLNVQVSPTFRNMP